MCVICVSRKGQRQPSEAELRTMFTNNPHGAGYMVNRAGAVEIHKGFMTPNEFIKAIKTEHFTESDPVVYHCRISTQAGISPEMTHPFPWSNRLEDMESLDTITADCAFAHNGIIRCTSDPAETRYSDTARFITMHMTNIIHGDADLRDDKTLDLIDTLTNSKWAIMDSTGYIATVGSFIEDCGLLFSNGSYRPRNYSGQCKNKFAIA